MRATVDDVSSDSNFGAGEKLMGKKESCFLRFDLMFRDLKHDDDIFEPRSFLSDIVSQNNSLVFELKRVN